ncbi:alpha/beta hydrolase [Povalibacter sp.]|uniref:alpha/beta hydrolase family protein n=1 Tax=Povalibacter sp. TaxID=1962978 RepID=UPI002F40FE90
MRIIVLLLAMGMASFAAAEGSCYSGAYELSDGSKLVIQPSDDDNLRYRFPDGVSGKLFPVADGYESGDGWSGREPVTLRVSFGPCGAGAIRFQRQTGPLLTGRKLALPTTAISFQSDNATLYGELVLPLQRPPRAVVVLQYGSGPDSAVTDNFLQYLLPLKDIAVFVFDKRGTGRSTGEFSAHIGRLAEDFAAAVRAVRGHAAVKDVPLGAMGESQGGWVVPLAATLVPVDFVVVSYGLAVSMAEEDRLEVAQALRAKGHGADVLAKGEEIHLATTRVMVSRFSAGLDELKRLKAAYRNSPWFADLGGDYTAPLMSTPDEQLPQLQKVFNFPYDLEYDSLPAIRSIAVPQLWVLAGEDTEAPHESTLARLQQLQGMGVNIEVKVFPRADHGMIVVEQGPQGQRLAGRTAPGYFELLGDWILARAAKVSQTARGAQCPDCPAVTDNESHGKGAPTRK